MFLLNQILLILHFLGLALGLAVPIANAAMDGLIAKAAGPDKAVLGRFPPVMGRIGSVGLVLLWVTGVTMVYTRWRGFGTLPPQFHVKLAAVILLTIAVGYIHVQQRRVKQGDAAALKRVQMVGKIAGALGLIAVVFAVLSFA